MTYVSPPILITTGPKRQARNGSSLAIVERGDPDYEAGENIVWVMDMWILLNNIWIPTFFTDSLQRLSFPNHVNFIARLVVDHVFLQHPNREFAFTT